MKIPVSGTHLLCVAVLLLAAAEAAGAQNIYKCTQAGQVAYTDHPCPGGNGKLIHQADDSEIIDQYLRLGQDAAAKRYADSHHLEALYKERLAARRQSMEKSQADEAIAAKQRDETARQQALADAAADRERLRAENDALRQQNYLYRDQLAQPAYNDPPIYWGAVLPLQRNHRHDHDAHRPPLSKEPFFHPCTQLAGGRVQC